jgi:glycosyltransferase involved in cell wall biosynthesis
MCKRNWVVFSGTLEEAQGLEQTVGAWRLVKPLGWELHIAGQGPLEGKLKHLADGDPSIVFHGLLNRDENAELLCNSRIGLNPQDVSAVPGNTFAFKIVEYLASGNHVITTPRGTLERELERGVSYISNNAMHSIAGCLQKVIRENPDNSTAEAAACRLYGPAGIGEALDRLLSDAVRSTRQAVAV